MKEHVLSHSPGGREIWFPQESSPPTSSLTIKPPGNIASETIYSRENQAHTNVGVLGNLTAVLENFYEKRERLLYGDPDHSQIRTAIVLDSGAMRWPFIAGAGIALSQKRLGGCADIVVGVSAGALVGMGLVSRAAERYLSIFENCTNNEFIKLSRFISGAADMEKVEEPLRDGFPDVRQSRIDLHVGVTHRTTGEGKFFNVKNVDDPISLVMASINIPVLSNRKFVKIEGEPYVDGGIANPLPIRYAVDELGANNIIVITPHPINEKPEFSFRAFQKIGRATLPSGLGKQIISIDHRRNEEMEFAMNLPKDKNIAVIYAIDMPSGWLSQNPEDQKKMYKDSFRQTDEFLSLALAA